MTTHKNKIAIVGAGLIGTLAAIQLGQLGFEITLIDAKEAEDFSLIKNDLRTLALSHFSYLNLVKTDLWSLLADKAFAINKIHISDQGHFGSARILADEFNVDALGYVISLKDLQQAFDQVIAQMPNVKILRPVHVKAIHLDSEQANLRFENNIENLSVDLLIAADGSHSSIRKYLNIKNHVTRYQQTAIVCNIEVENTQHIAYKRFTSSGQLALLLFSENYFSVVWSLTPEQAKNYLTYNDEIFLKQLQETFGFRAGEFKSVSARQSFPLNKIMADTMIQPHVILLGNAMHTLHPVAGQGFNLGLRDVNTLAKLLGHDHINLQDFALLKQYEKLRKSDQQSTGLITDALVKVFSNSSYCLQLARNTGLNLLEHTTLIKEIFTHKMMGYAI